MGNRSYDFSAITSDDWLELVEEVDRKRYLGAHISGMEVTQAIQYYKAPRHLTDASDRADDNSARLVAKKPAWVRVYLRSGILGISQTITGELELARKNSPIGLAWEPEVTLSPQAPGIVVPQANPDYALERSTLASTLNFIIPQDLMIGTLRLRAKIWQQGGAPDAPVDIYDEILQVNLLQTLRLRGIMISYNGPDPTLNPTNPPNVNLPAPTIADLQATAALTLTMNPVQSQGLFSSGGTVPWSIPLTGIANPPNSGSCSNEWFALNAVVAQAKTSDGNRNDVIYYGLLPTNTPIQNVGGCESCGVSTGPNGAQITMAHEIGHGAGLIHGPCGVPGDPNYPAYEPYDALNTPTASLGEYGLDINNGDIHEPTEKDYMSYCWPKWVSLYHHWKLIWNNKFDPQLIGGFRIREPLLVDQFLWPWEYIPDPPLWERHSGDLQMKAQKVISIIGIVNEDSQISIQSLMRVTALPSIIGALETTMIAQLRGKEGKVVATAPVMRLRSYAYGCHCEDNQYHNHRRYIFQAFVPDVEDGTAISIIDKKDKEQSNREAWTRTAPERAPNINEFNIRISKNQARADWKAKFYSDHIPEFCLQFSKDNGKSWNGLAVGIHEYSYEFNLSDLPVGLVKFKLLANDGFFTSTAQTKAMKLPKHEPTISILHPQDSSILVAGLPMRLWATVNFLTTPEFKTTRYVWTVDGKEVAHDIDNWIIAPKRGKHRCVFMFEHDGARSKVDVSFKTISP